MPLHEEPLPLVERRLQRSHHPVDRVSQTHLAFALAATLRFLTPVGDQPRIAETPPVFCGRLDDAADGDPPPPPDWKPTPALRVRPADGIYEFSDGDGAVPLLLRPLGQPGAVQEAFTAIATEALSRVDGCDPAGSPAHSLAVRRASRAAGRGNGRRRGFHESSDEGAGASAARPNCCESL